MHFINPGGSKLNLYVPLCLNHPAQLILKKGNIHLSFSAVFRGSIQDGCEKKLFYRCVAAYFTASCVIPQNAPPPCSFHALLLRGMRRYV